MSGCRFDVPPSERPQESFPDLSHIRPEHEKRALIPSALRTSRIVLVCRGCGPSSNVSQILLFAIPASRGMETASAFSDHRPRSNIPRIHWISSLACR